MNNTGLAAAISDPNGHVIFVSGYAEDSFDVEQAKIEHSSFLPKPFSLKQLIAAVDDQLNHLDPSEEGAMVHAVKWNAQLSKYWKKPMKKRQPAAFKTIE